MRPNRSAGRVAVAIAAVLSLARPAPAGAEGLDEAVPLTGGPASLAESVRVHIEGPGGSSSSAFDPAPNRRFYSRLPVASRGGLGAALREGPFSSSPLWLAFQARNETSDGTWILAADGAGFRPMAMVIVAEDGGRSYYSGEALDRMALRSGLPDLSAYALGLPAGETRTVYLKLANGGTLGPALRLWPLRDFLARSEAFAGFSSALGVYSIIICATFALAQARRYPLFGALRVGSRPEAAIRLSYPVLASVSILLGLSGGGVSALLGAAGSGRYLASVALGAAALAAEAWLAYLPASERREHPAGKRAIAALAAPRLALAALLAIAAFSTASPLFSFALPICLALVVSLSAIRETLSYMRKAKAGMQEAERLSAKLELEARGGRDFMTATAAALRGPLHGLIGMLEDLESIVSTVPRSSPAAVQDIALARSEASRLDNLVSNILSYSGLGPTRLSLDDLDLASVSRSAAALLRVALSGRGLRIDVDMPVVEIRSDVGFVHRLIYTAMNRAARTRSASFVRASAFSEESHVTVAIEDDGKDGSGGDVVDMDLVVLKRLAATLGGFFELRRVAGLNVHSVRLPRSAPAEVVALSGEAPERRFAAPSGSGLESSMEDPPSGASPRAARRALVAGNEPVALLATKRRLEAAEWRVDVTVSAAEALERVLGGEPYDIVIIDSSMPEMSGFAFCESVRTTRGPESVPIIVLTEAGRVDEIERAFRSGANDYIARPASGIELSARVKTHADLSSSVKRELAQAARMAEFDKYRTLAMLSAGVAHEINTPNNAVLRNVPMLKEIWSALEAVVERLHREESGFSVRGFGYDDLKREIPDMLNDLYMGAQDIKKIVEGLKDYARSPTDSPPPALVDANDAIRYAARLLKHTIAVSAERFDMSLAADLPPVRADRLKLTQVIVNVLENALQALPDKRGGVGVSTSAEEDGRGVSHVVVRVTDDGVGMSPEVLSSVFDPFFTTKRDRGGSGLGLPVASGIVHDLGGSIELRSEQGSGTTATIRIPAASRSEDQDGR